MLLGPVMTDVAGQVLSNEDIRRLQHPLVGGVILFARNYESPRQLIELTSAIHALRNPALPIAVDHEGGRVQRFREGFTAIPPMRALGEVWEQEPGRAAALAEQVGLVLAWELIHHGVDFSFAPVLDLDWGESSVIGNRSFHRQPRAVTILAARLIKGLSAAGMGAVGKHFPGHGYVRADSHHEIPVDPRTLEAIAETDLIPFEDLSLRQELMGIMPAHVIYPAIDDQPAGFSATWLKSILRHRLGFGGIVFSDDLSMEGASVAGAMTQRAHAALNAGCDMALICNDPAKADEMLAGLTADGVVPTMDLSRRLERIRALGQASSADASQYEAARNAIAALGLD
ncbi:MAG: beta-N-acetylhexosaminidase [Betaproteobacteria bacterium]